MTRHYSAATAARASRALVGFGAAFVLAVVASGCVGSAAPVPTPDPFAGLADRSDQAFRQGLEAYGQGQYRDALTSFESARTLSPTDDARIVQMIERSRAALAPTPTPVPPKPTEVPAVPTATPILMSTLTPDTELGRRFFGQVTLSMVPGRDSDAPAATQFFYQDQIGLHIEGLKQHLRLPFTMRVFNTDASRLVAEIQSEDGATAVPKQVSLQADPRVGLVVPTGLQAAAPTAVATATARDIQLARFWDTYVWYHKGGEEPGRYRVELFANGILSNSFDYSVGTEPIAAPEPTLAPIVEPTPALPSVQDEPPPPVPAVQTTTRPSQAASAPAAVRVAPPEPTPLPTPTMVPTPQTAYTTVVGGVPAGLDVDANRGRFYLADSSGLIWASDAPTGVNSTSLAPTGEERPTLGSPIRIGDSNPADLAVDPSTGFLYVSARKCAVAVGCILVVDPGQLPNHSDAVLRGSISLSAAPGDLRLDRDFGLLYVALPELRAIAEVNMRAGTVVRLIENLPQITSLALDPVTHTLYAAHFAGQLTVIDVPSGQVTSRMSLTGPGLASVAAARGLAYAVNTVTHELAVVEPRSQVVYHYPLFMEPAAVTASEGSGAVFVLSSNLSDMARIDPTDGREIGRVLLIRHIPVPALPCPSAPELQCATDDRSVRDSNNRSGHSAGSVSTLQSLHPRLVLNDANETVYATLPENGRLAAVTIKTFPVLAGEIPRIDSPDQPFFASIPGLIQPGGEALPSESAPVLLAQQSVPDDSARTTDAEGL